jgi:predicted metal-dependent peptidase
VSNFNYEELNKFLDRTKTHVFLKPNSAFLAALMCRLEFVWNEQIQTACASGIKIQWNPGFFLGLKPEPRKTVLVHELWHPAYMDGLRQGDRDPEIWNIACDIRINNGLEADGYSFEGIEWAVRNNNAEIQAMGLGPWSLDASAEQIYDDLIKQLPPPDQHTLQAGFGPPGSGDKDLEPNTPAQQQQVINVVLQAATVAKMNSKQAGVLPGEVEAFLEAFLKPVVPWQVLLDRFFSDQLDLDYDWSVRDRRFLDGDIYLPGEVMDESRLQSLAYIFDTSGSFTDDQLIRCNSEVKHIWDKYQPQTLTLVQFDTVIQNVMELKEGDSFNGLQVHGRGGTNLAPVRDWIQDHRPTAAIIFTDLHCRPMQPLTSPIPIIWLCIGNPQATVPFGTLIHIEE